MLYSTRTSGLTNNFWKKMMSLTGTRFFKYKVRSSARHTLRHHFPLCIIYIREIETGISHVYNTYMLMCVYKHIRTFYVFTIFVLECCKKSYDQYSSFFSQRKSFESQVWWFIPVNLSTERPGQQGHELEDSLAYIVRPDVKKKSIKLLKSNSVL